MKKKSIDLIMLILLIGYFIILVDTSLVFTCSDEIGATFNMSTETATWISNAYALTFGSLLLLGGRLGDVFERKNVFIIGLALFDLSSLSVGLSPSGIFLIASRAIQGIGAAIIAPATLAIIMDNYQGAKQAHEVAVYGMMSGVGVSLGLIIGAGITTILSWRWGFLVNVPLCAMLIVLTLKYIPKRKQKVAPNIDILGAITSFIAIVLIINGINGIGPKLVSLIIGLILLVLFIAFEAKNKQPILPLTIFKNKTRTLAYLVRFIYSGAITSFWFFTPRILQSIYHFSPIIVGLSFLPMTLVNFYSAGQVDRLARKIGQSLTMIIGLVITTIGFGLLIILEKGSNYWLVVALPMILVGFGQGLVLSPVTNLAIDHLPDDVAGAGSGLINVMLQIGGVVGLATLSIISDGMVAISAFHVQVIGVTVLSLISLVVSLFYLKK